VIGKKSGWLHPVVFTITLCTSLVPYCEGGGAGFFFFRGFFPDFVFVFFLLCFGGVLVGFTYCTSYCTMLE